MTPSHALARIRTAATEAVAIMVIVAVVVPSGCSRPWTNRLTLPHAHQVKREQLVIHSDFPLPRRHRLLEELIHRRDDIRDRLDVPISDEPIHVYLFESPDVFDRFVRLSHPEFPQRRAFFLKTDTRLLVYAQWGDYVADDLRHEVTHAYLHSVVPSLPIWLDEGLAEYFEVPRGRFGLNRSQLHRMAFLLVDKENPLDLARLENLDPSRDMAQDDYAESWAWVHFLMETRPEFRRLLRDYLADLRRDGVAEPISIRLRGQLGDPARSVKQHVLQLVKTDSTR